MKKNLVSAKKKKDAKIPPLMRTRHHLQSCEEQPENVRIQQADSQERSRLDKADFQKKSQIQQPVFFFRISPLGEEKLKSK